MREEMKVGGRKEGREKGGKGGGRAGKGED